MRFQSKSMKWILIRYAADYLLKQQYFLNENVKFWLKSFKKAVHHTVPAILAWVIF